MPLRTNLRSALFAGAAIAAVIATAAQAQTGPVNFDIASGDLNTALASYAKQSGVELFYQSRIVEGRSTQGLHGAFAPREALDQLLKGTGLVLAMDQSGAMVVKEASAPQSGSAAGDGADSGTVQALIVTAQKREENIQDVPIAMSAFTQEALERSQVAGGPDLMTQVPNMTFTKTNFSSYSIQLRGIGTQAISATTDPAVAVAFNNTPFVRNRFFEQEFYDLQRVEVLRGPQGTLYGRNATAGVVNLISQKPKFAYEAKLSADVSNYRSSRLEGMVNVPLVDDKVALRLAGAWTKREGYSTNEITGNPIDGRDLWSTRLSLRMTPTDRVDANLIWEHFEENDDRLRSGKQLCHKHIVTEVGGLPVPYEGQFPGSQSTYYQSQLSQGCAPASLYAPESFETPNGYQFGFYFPLSAIGLPRNRDSSADPYVSNVQSRDLRVVESTVDPSYKAKTDTIELQVGIDLTDSLSLTSETAWSSDFIFSTQDYNRFNTKPGAWADSDPRPGVLNNGVFCDPQVGCADRLVLVDLSTARSRHFSQEFRLGSNFDGPFNFSVGANFLRYDTEDKYYVFINAVSLWAAAAFASGIESPYVGGVSDNHECFARGFQIIDVNNYGGVSSAGNCRYIDPNPIGSLNDLGHNYFLSKNPYKLISYAAFGEAYYQLTDNLKVTAGLRWTVDKKEAPRIPNWITAADIGYPVLEVIEQEWKKPTGRLTIDWKPDLSFTDETLLYASFAHGYKAGGANPPPAGVALNVNTGNGRPEPSATHPATFDPEYVNAFEIGAKNTMLDGRMTLNLAGFYYDYTGYQISQIVDRSAINYNFDAEVWGLEVEADWRPIENLHLAFKGGYENTKVGDGERAVDVMDRANGGRPDVNGVSWIVVKPFPIYPSNCIVPVSLFTGGGQNGYVQQLGNVSGSSDGPCDISYFRGLDIMTMQPYVADPQGDQFWPNGGHGGEYPNYPGFNPATAPNNGEGFFKDLSGNELPNAPHLTATLTADWTLPLPNDWLMTLHSDLYYQSEAWTRIFNMQGYDKLKAYTNVNLAAIFANEDAGWKVMAYIKNVMDRDSITGAFLNSDDTGLTTNVFLTEPRLYGLRVTKEFSGGPWWTGANASHRAGDPYPVTIELGGQIQRQDAPYEPLEPAFAASGSPALDIFAQAQRPDLDWGDGREIKVTYRPSGPWSVSLGARFGRTNGTGPFVRAEEETAKACGLAGTYYAAYCDPNYQGGASYDQFTRNATNWATARSSQNNEEHAVIDFMLGRDVGIGGLDQSTVLVGLRYANLSSRSSLIGEGVLDWYLPEGWFYNPAITPNAPYASLTRSQANLLAKRKFTGEGPMLSWAASERLWGDEANGASLEWSIGAGVLFGKQKTDVSGSETQTAYLTHYPTYDNLQAIVSNAMVTDVRISRSRSVTTPTVGASIGFSYEVQRLKVGAGYRWERYFDVLDVGQNEEKKADRTIDGPYFKIAVGFGG